MDKLQKDWFDRLQISYVQAPDGFLGIHVCRIDKNCQYFEMPASALESEDFFGMVYQKARELWDIPDKHLQIQCPICNHTFLPFHFRYKGRFFCRWCGSHYYTRGTKVIIIRPIGGRRD